jgi:hypothetical protein
MKTKPPRKNRPLFKRQERTRHINRTVKYFFCYDDTCENIYGTQYTSEFSILLQGTQTYCSQADPYTSYSVSNVYQQAVSLLIPSLFV